LGDLFDSYDIGKIHSNPGVRWDLFPGGEQAGRSRRVVDFFGNVQGVEVAGNKPAAESLKEDLEGLKRLIKEYEGQAVFQDRSRSSTGAYAKSNTTASSQHILPRRNADGRVPAFDPGIVTGAMSITETGHWTRRISGAALLSGLAAAWYLGASYT
jgi:predicted phage tail protein